MLKDHITKLIRAQIAYELTHDQETLLGILGDFALMREGNSLLLIKGYAGTGKTSMISAFIRALSVLKIKTVLLAPTGRAAKVLSGYSETAATTIHKRIYRQKSSRDAFGEFSLDKNLYANTFFIVDEASMISDRQQEFSVFGTGNLLHDLFGYVYNNRNCKLILVGDTAQLPPVGASMSLSMNRDYLKNFADSIVECELHEVVRQVRESGILSNASEVRNLIRDENPVFPKFKLDGFSDIMRIQGNELMDHLSEAYSKYGNEETIVVCRSNRIANRYNQGIRGRILYREEELSAGDYLMVVKNNYFWLHEENDKTDFIANGDIIRVKRLKKYEEIYGFRFAEADVVLPDYGNLELSVKLIMDTVYSESPALTSEDNKRFYYAISEDYKDIRSQKARYEKIKENPHFNALQVKFAYAVTCHKSQGGQWKAVFIDQSFFRDEMLTQEYLKWLYTALTRATDKVFLVNFGDKFFS